jgi:hypothetical protein
MRDGTRKRQTFDDLERAKTQAQAWYAIVLAERAVEARDAEGKAASRRESGRSG